MKAGIYTVGGSPEPIFKCILSRRPDYVLFVVSRGSDATVERDILAKLDYEPVHAKVVVENENSLEDVYDAVRRSVPKWLEKNELNRADVYFNYTGGTKSMSAGLVLAAVELLPTYYYISGDRDAGGLGRVISGREQHQQGGNPWYRYAIRERTLATEFLRVGQADEAAKALQSAIPFAVDPDGELKFWATFCEMLGEQQRFDFKQASAKYREIERKLGWLEQKDPSVAEWFGGQKEYLASLQKEYKNNEAGSRTHLLNELLLNAERCARGARYDDASARLYRAAELHGQNCLSICLVGANLGKIFKKNVREADWELASSLLSAQNLKRNKKQEEFLECSLKNLYEFLAKFDPRRYGDYDQIYAKQLGGVMHYRNDSILAHGVSPIGQEKFEAMRSALYESLGLEPPQELQWPELDFAKV